MKSREKLLNAAEARLLANGPDGFVLDAIAADAEISKGGLWIGVSLPIRFAPLVTVVVTAVPHNYGFLGGSQNAVSAYACRVSRSVPG